MSKSGAEWKVKEVEELSKLINEYKVIGIASLHKVRASQLQMINKMLKSDVTFHVSKNTLMRRALEKCGKKKANLKKLTDHITGSNVFMFTNIDPFKLSLTLRKNKVKIAAKAGDVAPKDIIVSAGNTGLPPGPIIAELAEVGLPTRIETGSVIITKDACVAKKGDVISPQLASILSKLGIKPIEVNLIINVAYDNGLILTSDLLQIDPEMVEQQFQEAVGQALNLAYNSAYPTKETIPLLLIKARMESYALAVNAAHPALEVVSDLLRKAYSEMLNLSSQLEPKMTTIVKQEEKVEKEAVKEKKETVKEERSEKESLAGGEK